MEKYGVELIWKDRKRYLGMPLSFTRYALSEDRLFLSVGFRFGVGTVTVVSSDKTMPTLQMKNIRNPVAVKELLHNRVEEMKIRRRVRLGEIMTTGQESDDDDDPDDGLDDDR